MADAGQHARIAKHADISCSAWGEGGQLAGRTAATFPAVSASAKVLGTGFRTGRVALQVSRTSTLCRTLTHSAGATSGLQRILRACRSESKVLSGRATRRPGRATATWGERTWEGANAAPRTSASGLVPHLTTADRRGSSSNASAQGQETTLPCRWGEEGWTPLGRDTACGRGKAHASGRISGAPACGILSFAGLFGPCISGPRPVVRTKYEANRGGGPRVTEQGRGGGHPRWPACDAGYPSTSTSIPCWGRPMDEAFRGGGGGRFPSGLDLTAERRISKL